MYIKNKSKVFNGRVKNNVNFITAIIPVISVQFDQLGLTDNQNPFGGFASLLGKKRGQRTGKMLNDYVGKWMEGQRLTGSASAQQNSIHKYFHGGER